MSDDLKQIVGLLVGPRDDEGAIEIIRISREAVNAEGSPGERPMLQDVKTAVQLWFTRLVTLETGEEPKMVEHVIEEISAE